MDVRNTWVHCYPLLRLPSIVTALTRHPLARQSTERAAVLQCICPSTPRPLLALFTTNLYLAFSSCLGTMHPTPLCRAASSCLGTAPLCRAASSCLGTAPLCRALRLCPRSTSPRKTCKTCKTCKTPLSTLLDLTFSTPTPPSLTAPHHNTRTSWPRSCRTSSASSSATAASARPRC